jgi:hypothetical protein
MVVLENQEWWSTSVIPVFWSSRKEDCKFKANLAYIVGSGKANLGYIARLVSKKKKKKGRLNKS